MSSLAGKQLCEPVGPALGRFDLIVCDEPCRLARGKLAGARTLAGARGLVPAGVVSKPP